MRQPCRTIVAIVGPTASGKSQLALALAEALAGEIVGCDALQVYRHLDIGTGKVPPSERRGIPHHLIDVVEPSREFSAAEYLYAAVPVIQRIVEQGERRGSKGQAQRGGLPFIVGGTGLYLRALRRGLFEGPGRAPEVRERVRRIAERRGPDFVWRMLARMDAPLAARVHVNDLVRVTRAIEVRVLAGRPMSDLMKRRLPPLPGYRFLIVGLAPPREELQARIEARVLEMFDSGLVKEVQGLLERYGSDAPAFKAIGYREVGRYLRGELSRDEAMALTIRATVQYAKRQMTWFRREPEVRWFAGHGGETRIESRVRDCLEAALETSGRGEDILHAKTAS